MPDTLKRPFSTSPHGKQVGRRAMLRLSAAYQEAIRAILLTTGTLQGPPRSPKARFLATGTLQ